MCISEDPAQPETNYFLKIQITHSQGEDIIHEEAKVVWRQFYSFYVIKHRPMYMNKNVVHLWH